MPVDIWERAGYSRKALGDNRRGLLAMEQRHLVFGPMLLVFVGFMVFAAFVMLKIVSNAPWYVDVVFAPFLLLFFAIGAMGTWAYWNDWRGNVRTFCGDLTKWESVGGEGSDAYGLKHGKLVVSLTAPAYAALPERAHYRIYYSRLTLHVVNVEEHTATHSTPVVVTAAYPIADD